jgi:peptidoglycan/xylan/chitin deacetylase (PgdA/CDA1 family)
MKRKPKQKVKIKNLPRFITLSIMTIIVVIMILMGLFFLMSKMVSLFNAQKEAIHSASIASATQNNATTEVDKTNTNNQKDTPKNNGDTQKNAELEAIKSRLRSGDTKGLKVVFLTFDDGPTDNTGEVLDILKKYNVKGTFFTTLHDSESAKSLYKRIVDEGHTLANHTSSHDYSLYNNPSAFYADVDKLDQYQKKVTGLTETSHIFRFPGGSLNANETCIQGMVSRDWNYADWNVSSGDGSSDPPTRDVVAQTIIAGCHSNDVSVVLCHAELKPETRAAIATVVETLQAEGYTFLPMEKDFTYPRQLEV